MRIFTKSTQKEFDFPPAERLPKHIAFIMDGNGRWAKQRNLPRTAGHAAGTEALRDIITAVNDLGIESMSIYAFSTENWHRPAEEVGVLMSLLTKYFRSEIAELTEKNVRITILGDVNAFPPEQKRELIAAMERTKDNTGLKLNIALNYGGRAEILRSVKAIAEACVKGEMNPEDISIETMDAHMYTAGQKDVDLVIRTSGEERLSNFMLWQSWYSELIFEPVYWPDYTVERLHANLMEYASRDRRFGKVKAK